MNIKIDARTIAGKHSQNCDYFVAELKEEQFIQGIFCVFDGVNSLVKGADASRLCGTILQADFFNNYPIHDQKEWLFYEFKKINRQLRLKSDSDKLLTTGSALLFNKVGWELLHTGDSRIYLIDKNPRLLTEDQTLFNDMIKKGLAKEEDKIRYREKNILTHALGQHSDLYPVSDSGKIEKNLAFILVTDGISDYLEIEEIVEKLESQSFENAYDDICKIAKEKGSIDDKTLLYIRINYD